MTAPITPDERAAMRETIATLDAAWEADDPTRPLVTEHAALALLAHVAAQVPRLLDALDTAEDEVARLRAARPAPVWDEDTVTEAVARAMFPHFFTDDRQPLRVFTETRSDAELREAERESARHRARQALAVVREHLPVRPDRETIADVLIECGTWCGMADVDHENGPCPACIERARGDAHAVLLEWPGESRATVQAEALRDAADELNARLNRPELIVATDGWGSYYGGVRAAMQNEESALRARADRLEKGETR